MVDRLVKEEFLFEVEAIVAVGAARSAVEAVLDGVFANKISS